MSAPPRPVFDAGAARSIAASLYGLDVAEQPVELPSERDRNFLLRAAGGEYVLKLSHPDEPHLQQTPSTHGWRPRRSVAIRYG